VQKLQGTIENQRAALDRYVATNGVTLYGAYSDDGVSGYAIPFALRPDGARLLADVRAGHVTLIVVTKLDRLGRNAREILIAVNDLQVAGARLISLKENVDTSTPAGRFYLTVLSGVAELERDTIIERKDEGTARRLVHTAWMGGHPPMGYRVEGRKRDARLVRNETVDARSGYSEADTYRLTWHLCVEAGWSCEDIADRLSELAIPTPTRRSTAWSPQTIYQILTNPAYKGELTYTTKTGEVVTHVCPALITPEHWDRAQAALADHRRYTSKSKNAAYLLRDLMRCGLCGTVYTTTSYSRLRAAGPTGEVGKVGKVGEGEPMRIYVCSRRRNHRHYARRTRGMVGVGSMAASALDAEETCHAPTLSAVWAEQHVWQRAEHYIRHPQEALALLAARMGTSEQAAEKQRERVATAQAALVALQGERDTVVRLFRQGRIDEVSLNHQLDELAVAEGEARAERDGAMAALATATVESDRMASARSLLQALHAEMDAGPLTLERKRGFLERIIRSIVVETHSAGLSLRNRPKYRAEVVVYWAFDDPDTPDSQSLQKCDASSVVCRA
jgi:site-specific DNA recombinase